MIDQAHAYADDVLMDIERRVSKEYARALRDLQDKLLKHMNAFKDDDRAHRKAVKDGSETPEEYARWRQAQMMQGQRWSDAVENMARGVTDTAQISMDIINGRTPDVFAENHNYGAYEIESGTTIDTSYTLYDRDTVMRLLQYQPDLYPQASLNVPKDMLWNRRHITSAVTQGILQGESIPDIAKRMRRVAQMSKVTATRAARTCVTGAENAGRVDSYRRAIGMGIRVKKQWLATLDERTRASHRKLDGESVDIDAKFSNGLRYPGDPDGEGSEVYSCRCTLVADLEEFPAKEVKRASKLHGMSYDEWKEGHHA